MAKSNIIIDGYSWNNQEATHWDIDSGLASIDEKNPRYVLHGFFKGYQDFRGQRCYKNSCRSLGYAQCLHCGTLPYVSLSLRKTRAATLTIDATADRPRRSNRALLDAKLRVLLKELQDFAETDFMASSKYFFKTFGPNSKQASNNGESLSPEKSDHQNLLSRTSFVDRKAKFWVGQPNHGRLNDNIHEEKEVNPNIKAAKSV